MVKNEQHNIEHYIQQVKNRNVSNTSVGGSESFNFGDVTLILYYGRDDAEQVMQMANEKNAKGIRTPKHLAVKRETVSANDKQAAKVFDTSLGDCDICWVLQETFKGKSFTEYCSGDIDTKLKMQAILANAPTEHYAKLISDAMEITGMGYELKPKNMAYDESTVNGGFSIIDLTLGSGKSFDNSLKDVLKIYSYMDVVQCSGLSWSDKESATEGEKKLTAQQHNQIQQKILLGMEKAIPNFEQHRRWVLRSTSPIHLENFKKMGFCETDLSLTEQEQSLFSQLMQQAIDACFSEDKDNPTNRLIGNLDRYGLQDSWRYHAKSEKRKDDFEDDYDYKRACANELEKIAKNIIQERQIMKPKKLSGTAKIGKNAKLGDEGLDGTE